MNGKITDRNGVGVEWDVRKWKREIESGVKADGLRRWKHAMERKSTLEWYKEKEAPKCVSWCDGSLGGDLLFQARAQCMNVAARNYRWSESHSKVCQMCDMGEDETVAHVVMECEKYERERAEMMRVVESEVDWSEDEVNGVVVRTEREWMLLLLGLSGEWTVRMVEAVKSFLERMWSVRNRE